MTIIITQKKNIYNKINIYLKGIQKNHIKNRLIFCVTILAVQQEIII